MCSQLVPCPPLMFRSPPFHRWFLYVAGTLSDTIPDRYGCLSKRITAAACCLLIALSLSFVPCVVVEVKRPKSEGQSLHLKPHPRRS